MSNLNYESARSALFDLDCLHTRMENALELLYAVYEAERQGNIPQALNAKAIWSVWDYMSDITRSMGGAIKAGIHVKSEGHC